MVAGEGCFSISHLAKTYADGSPKLRFVFGVTMAQRDRPLLVALRQFLGYGAINDIPRPQPHWQPISTFTIASHKAHHAATIPFAEQFIPRYSNKWRQFSEWRDELRGFETRAPLKRGRSICSMPGCDDFVRGQGLCRRHYYRVTGY